MAKKPAVETMKTRSKLDYFFEDHVEGAMPKPLGLVLHTPGDAAIVQSWLQEHAEQFGIEGTVKVCKKIYG